MKKLMSALFALSLAAGCKGEDVAASVNCKILAGPTIECSVAQTKGKSELDICWDFKATCTNGATMIAERTCQKVKDGQTSTVTVASDKIKVEGKCDGNPTGTLMNMTYNGKKSEL